MDTTVRDPLLGHLLDGRYRVASRIARGGMASVYLAVDTRLDRTVAVKVMHAVLAADEEFVARFIREAKSAARLSHPNVVSVFDQGTDGDTVFLAMEHVEGRTLRDLLRARGALPPRQAFEVLEPVLAALGAAHRAGIVHRDVKPENVLLADDGRVKVADFGLARAVTSTTASAHTAGLLIGTVAYLSPEQVERGIADPRSDVYSAGILLFEMLTGAQPFDGDTPIQVAYRHVHDAVPAPSTLVPELPRELDRLVVRATRRDPDGRPTDADRLLAEVLGVRRALPAAALDSAPAPAARTPYAAPSTASAERATGATAVLPAQSPATPLPATGAAAGSASAADGAHPTMVVGHDTAPLPQGAGQRHAARRPGRRLGAVVIALLLVVAAALGGGAWYLGSGPGAFRATPSFLGMTQAEADAAAERAGIELAYGDPEHSETVARGTVLDTDPAPTERVRRDGTVTAVLSLGPERFPVPAVVGRPQADAESLLTDGGLTVGDVSGEFSETVAEGLVISTDPEAGKPLRTETPVALVVSEGREPIEVPDVTGERAERAVTALEGLGLEVAAERTFDDAVPAGRVVSQHPADGTLFRGDVVRLVVSQGPPLVDVPRVVDRRIDEARQALETAGFQVRTRGTSILGRVLVQSPGGGQAPRGSTVVLTTV